MSKLRAFKTAKFMSAAATEDKVELKDGPIKPVAVKPEHKMPEGKTPEHQTPEHQTPEPKTPEHKTPEIPSPPRKKRVTWAHLENINEGLTYICQGMQTEEKELQRIARTLAKIDERIGLLVAGVEESDEELDATSQKVPRGAEVPPPPTLPFELKDDDAEYDEFEYRQKDITREHCQ